MIIILYGQKCAKFREFSYFETLLQIYLTLILLKCHPLLLLISYILTCCHVFGRSIIIGLAMLFGISVLTHLW